MNMQALVDGMNAQWMRERAETQMTLGKLIDALAALPQDTQVERLGDEHSYRGYYSDLAFERFEGTIPASELLATCRRALGKRYEGYKGGDYYMHEGTPVWIADYGRCGLKIMALNADGSYATAEDD
jgi:hypothetical protein